MILHIRAPRSANIVASIAVWCVAQHYCHNFAAHLTFLFISFACRRIRALALPVTFAVISAHFPCFADRHGRTMHAVFCFSLSLSLCSPVALLLSVLRASSTRRRLAAAFTIVSCVFTLQVCLKKLASLSTFLISLLLSSHASTAGTAQLTRF